MISGLPENAVDSNTILLDIASKQGEFVYAVYKKFGKAIASKFYSIPTSKIAYEFTRKVYKLLELDVNLIEANYTSYDLISENKFIENETIKIDVYDEFGTIVNLGTQEGIYHLGSYIGYTGSNTITDIYSGSAPNANNPENRQYTNHLYESAIIQPSLSVVVCVSHTFIFSPTIYPESCRR